MTRATALLTVLLAACGRREPSGAGGCPQDPSFDRSRFVQVRAVAPPARLRRDLDLAGLAKESGGTTGGGRPQGLTAVDHQLRFSSRLNLEASRGRNCVWLEEVGVDLTPASVQIFVPREYPEDSCEYDAILAHEREHERIHSERLAAAAAEIRSALAEAKWIPAKGNPMEAKSQEEAEAALNAKIRKVVTPVYAKYKEDLAAAQAELDQPALYQWVSKRCQAWK